MKKWTRQRECHILLQKATLASHISLLTCGAKQLKKVNTFEIHSELMQLRLTLDAAVTPLGVCVAQICLTCLTCVPVSPFLFDIFVDAPLN